MGGAQLLTRSSSPKCWPVCVWQSELSDGISMLVAGNDRVQAVITQMEEVCQTIEVRLGWEGGKVSGLLEVDHK